MKKIAFVLLWLPVVALAKEPVYPNMGSAPHTIEAWCFPLTKPIQGDYLYMATTEVSNASYLQFLDWTLKNNPAAYQSNLPDTTKWKDPRFYNEPFVQYYLRHDAYKEYPVVNVSQQQARNFCMWLHDRLVEYYKVVQAPVDEFIVRLPTEKEWMTAARLGLPPSAIYPWEGNNIRWTADEGKKRNIGFVKLNVRLPALYDDDMPGRLNEMGFITMPVQSYWPSAYGFYHLSGNVAEWVNESGKTKGGSWKFPPYNARIDVPGFYDGDSGARSETGFRYVIEVISVKDKKANPLQITQRHFEKHLCPLPKDSTHPKQLFAWSTEVSNAEYNAFLHENNLPENRITPSGWDRYFAYRYFHMYGRHSAWAEYPVVNISHRAAQAYCKWLTEKYNALHKRKYKKVVFHLPDEKEWEYAARGGVSGSGYPWGGPYLRNSKGCYLANFAPYSEASLARIKNDYIHIDPTGDSTSNWSADGAFIPTLVTSYFPNRFGLYNCAGNVAEMLNEPGKSKGGSWASVDHFIRIENHETYTEASPSLGFRVFMEVIEN